MATSPLKSAFAWLRNKAIRLADRIEASNRSTLPATALEKRILLSGTPIIEVVGVVATITAGTCADDGSDDIFELETNGSGPNPMYRVTLNGGAAANIGRVNEIAQIRIIGSTDNDRFIIEQDAIPVNGLTIDGQAGGGTNEVLLVEPIALVGGDPSFNQINYEVADTESTVTFVNQGTPSVVLTNTVTLSNIESLADALVVDAREILISSADTAMSVSHVDTANTDVNLIVNANRSFAFESAIESTSIEVTNAAAQEMDLIQFSDASVDFSITMDTSDSLVAGSGGEVVAEDAIFDAGSIEVKADIVASNGGEIQLRSDGEISIAANLTAATSISLFDASLISIDSTANRIFQATTGDILSQTTTAIQLDGGASTVSFFAGNNVQLAGVTSVNSPANGTSLAIQAGGNVDLKTVQLAGTDESGSLNVSFDTDNTGADTLSVAGIISDVSTLQFAGGSDGNEVVDINADITAGSIQIQNAASVLVDASAARSLSSLNGNVSIFTNVTGIQFDNGGAEVAINSMGGSVQLSSVDTLGSDLTINSRSNVTLADVQLNGTSGISIDFDSDNDEAGILQLNGNIQNATSVTFDAGGTGTNDRINVAGNIDADAGSIDFGDASLVAIDALVARSINADVGNVVLDTVGEIELTGGSETITISALQDVRLADVSDVAAADDGASLTVQAGGNISLNTIALDGAVNDGNLNVSFDTDNTGANTLSVGGIISDVSTLQFAGGSDGNEVVDINADITADSIEIRNAASVLVDASAARSLSSLNGDVSIFTNVTGIQFDNGTSEVAINSMGGSVQLSNVDTLGSDLTINSRSNVTLADVELNGTGGISVDFDSDNDEAGILQLNGNIQNARFVTFDAGGTGTNDRINVAGNIDADAGSIDFGDASLVSIVASVARSINADVGTILLDSVGEIQLTGGSETITMSAGQNVRLADVNDVAAGNNGASLTVEAGGNVNLESVVLDGAVNDGDLIVSFDTDNTGANTLSVAGIISDVSTLQFAGGSDGNEVVDINADITADSIEIRNAASIFIDASVNRSLSSLDGNVSIFTNITDIHFDNGGSEVSISSMGGDVQLNNVDTLGSDLTINSRSNVTLADVELKGTGGISIDVDSDDNEAGILQLNGNIQNARFVTFDAGGTGTNDRINVAGNVDAGAGSIDFGDASLVSIDASVARLINADAGSVQLGSVGAIQLTTGAATISVVAAENVELATVSSTFSDAADLIVQAGDDVTLQGIDLGGSNSNGLLNVTFDTDGGGSNVLQSNGIIRNITSLGFASGTAASNIIDINSNITAESIDIRTAAQVVIDASANRDLIATAGNVSINQSIGGIEIDGGSNLVSLESTSEVLLASVTTTADAALSIQFDSDSDETLTFALDGSISGVSALTVSGGGVANGDQLVITSNLTTTAGDIDLQNVELVSIDSSVGRTLQADGGSVLIDTVGSIELTNGSATVELIADQNVQLAALSDSDGGEPGANIDIQAGQNVNLSSVSLAGTTNDGSLTIAFDTDNTGTDTLSVGGIISDVSTLQFAGGLDGNEVVDINADITAGNIQIQNAASVTIDASTARSLTSLAGNVSIFTNVTGIQFDNGTSEVAINSMGGSVQLSNFDTLGSDLMIDSQSNVTLADVQLNGTSGISIDFDSDDNESGFLQLNGNIQNATSVTFDAGGTGTNDRINVAGNIDADAGSIDFGDASLVSIDASVDRLINAYAGTILLDSAGAIELAGGSETITMDAGQNISLTDLSDVGLGNDAASLTVRAGGNISLDTIVLDGPTNDGSLTVLFGTAAGAQTLLVASEISSIATLQFSGGLDGTDIIDIDIDLTANSIGIESVESVLIDSSVGRRFAATAGDVRIANNVAGIRFDNGNAAVEIDSVGGSVALSSIETFGSSLTIDSQSDVTFNSIELNNTGILNVTFDSDSNESARFEISDTVSGAAEVTLSGGGTGTDDEIFIAGDLSTVSGSIDIRNADVVSIDASADRHLRAVGGEILVDSNIAIELVGGSFTVSMIADQDIRLGSVNDSDGGTDGASLNVQAGGNVSLEEVALTGSTVNGSLNIAFDNDSLDVNTLSVNGIVRDTAALVWIGGNDGNDIVDIKSNVSAGSIEIRAVSQVLIDATTNRRIESDSGDVSMFDSVTSIDVDGVSELAISSAGNATLSSINFLNSGSLDVQVDNDNNSAATLQLQGAVSGASSIKLSGGGTGSGDEIMLTTGLDTSAGNIEISNADIVSIDAASDRLFQANGGSVLFTSVGAIELADGSSTIFVVADQDVSLTDVSADNLIATGASLNIQAGNNVTLQEIDLGGSTSNGSFNVAFDTNDTDINTLSANGSITSVATLEWLGGSDGNDVIDIAANVSAGNVDLRSADKVIFDVSANRQLASLEGDVSIFQAVNEIEVVGSALLTIDSVSNVTLAAINALDDASIEINIDTDSNEAAALQLNAVAGVSSLNVFGGGLGDSDRVNLGDDIEVTGGDIQFSDVDIVAVDATADRNFEAIGGSLLIDQVGELQLTGGSTVNIVAEQDVRLTGIRDVDGGVTGVSLDIQADGNVSLQSIELAGTTTDGSLIVAIDNNNAGAETLTANGVIESVSQLQFSGGSDNNDVFDLNNNITSKSIGLKSAKQVSIDAATLRELSTTDGNLFIFDAVEEIRFDNGNAAVELSSNGGSVQLGNVTTEDSNLSVHSGSNVTLSNVDLNNNGALDVIVDSDDNEAAVIQLTGLINGASEIKFAGGGVGTDDSIAIAGDLISINGNIEIQNIDQISIDASAARVLQANNGDLIVGNDINLVNGSELISLDANNGSVRIETVLDDGIGASAASLSVESDEGINFTNFNLNDGGLSLTFDADDNGAETLSISGTSVGTFGHLALSGGGTGAGDTINIAASLTASDGSIDIRNAEIVSIDASVNRAFEANGGDVLIDSNVGRIELTGGDSSVSIASENDVRLAEIRNVGPGAIGASLSIQAENDVELKSIELAGLTTNGSLEVLFDTDNGNQNSLLVTDRIGSIRDLKFVGGTDLDDVIDINADISADSITIESAGEVLVDTSSIRRLESVNGDLSISLGVSEIIFAGGETLAVVADGGSVELADASTTDSDLNIKSSSSVRLNAVALNNIGELEVEFDTDDNEAGSLDLDGVISGAVALTFSGGGDGDDDTINISHDLTASNGNIEIEDSEFIRIDTAADRLIQSNQGDVLIDDDLTLVNESGLLTIRSIAGKIELDGVRSEGTAGVASSLLVESDGGIEIGDVDLDGGTIDGSLDVHFDFNDDGAETLSINGTSISNVSDIQISGGGTGTDDLVLIAADLTASNGNVEIQRSSLVSMDLSSDRSITAENGQVFIFDQIDTIQLMGGSEKLKIVANGSVQLADVKDVGAFDEGASLEVVSNQSIELRQVELAGIFEDGDLEIRFDQDDLLARGPESLTLDGNIQNVASLLVDGGLNGSDNSVELNIDLHVTGGDVEFRNIETVTSTSTGMRRIQADGGDVRFAGIESIDFSGETQLVAGSDFDLGDNSRLSAAKDIVVQAGENIVLRQDSLLSVTDSTATITGIAGNTVILENGARVERPLALGNKVVISNFPPDVSVGSPVLENGISNIDRLGQSVVEISVGEANVDKNFKIVGRSTKGNVLFDSADIPGPSLAGDFAFPLQFDFITGVTTLNDQDLVVTFQSDVNNQIVFIANGKTLTTSEIEIQLRGPLDGLISAITIKNPEIPDLVSVAQVDEIPFETTVENLNDVAEVQVVVNNQSEAEVEQERKYQLRLVIGKDEEQNICDLSGDALDQEKLSQLFNTLPDDRYRIYLILEDNTEQRVLDVNIRDKQAVEVESEGETLQFRKLDVDMDLDQTDQADQIGGDQDLSFDTSSNHEVFDVDQTEYAALEPDSDEEFLLVGKIPIDLRAG